MIFNFGTRFLAGLRLQQSNEVKAYLPDKSIVAESIRKALEEEKLKEYFCREFTFVNTEMGLLSPELDRMIEEAEGSIIGYWDYSSFSQPGHILKMNHRTAKHLLEFGEESEKIEGLAKTVHENYIPIIERKLEYYHGKESSWSQQLNFALSILKDERRIRA